MATTAIAISAEGRVRSMRAFTEEEVEILMNYRVCEKPKTNADRIRSMSDEELAEFLANFAWDNEPTKKDTYEWLQSEVKV